ncbi:MAG: OmpA family protein [Burkholderiaceae bacterium]
MKTHPLRPLLYLAAIGCLMAPPAFAQESGYSYGGLSLGQARARIDQQRITAGLLGAGLATTNFNSDNTDSAYKLFGGYQFHPNFAVEAGYFNLGNFGFTATTVPPGTLNGRMRVQGLNLDLVGTLPLSERWSATARVGVQYARTHDRFRSTGVVGVQNPSPSARDTNYKLGIGLQYAVNPSMLVRLDAERYRINDAIGNRGDVNFVSVSLVFPFGRAAEPAPRTTMAPVYVAPVAEAPAPMPTARPAPLVMAAAPAPVVVAAPERKSVRFSADTLFAFDQSDVRPEGRAALDAFTRDLQGTAFDVVIVEGHTDRLGSDAYNQKLSTRRAEAVRTYLVATGGLDGAKVTAVGRGESAPVTAAGDCVGNRASAKLLACLQPDRRVEVEVSGTR